MNYILGTTQRLRRNLLFQFLAAGLLLTLSVQTFAAPGDLDLSFGISGMVITRGNSYNHLQGVSAMALQSDGKIVVVGVGNDGSNNWDFSIVRYNTNGSLDTSFGGTGIVIAQAGDSNDNASSVAIQADGKIVVGGVGCGGFGTYCTGGPGVSAIIRFNPDGTLDTSFNGTGKVITSGEEISSVAIQSNGKIVVVGSTQNGSSYVDSYIRRYESNGSPDISFNGTGKIVSLSSRARSVTLQSDSKIVVAGSFDTEVNRSLAVFRYNSDGTPDTSFNGTGKAITSVGNSHSDASDLAIQPDGKIVVSGHAFNGTGDDFAFVRFNSNGLLDHSFNGTGTAITPIGPTSYVLSLAVQSDGRIVAAGYSSGGNVASYFTVVRLTPNGSLDTSFNGTGKIVTSISNGNDYAAAIAVQADGKIVAAGGIDYLSDHYDFVVVRYQTDANSTSVGGRVTTPDGRGLRNATVSMIDGSGISRSVTTSSFGLYTFDGVGTGQACTLAVSSKRFRFTSRVVNVDAAFTNVDFVGQE